MDVFYSEDPKDSGGQGRIPVRKVMCLEVEEFLELEKVLSRVAPREFWVVKPPKKDPHKSKAKPMIWVRESAMDRLMEYCGKIPIIPDEYLEVLSAMMKEKFALREVDALSHEARKYYEKKIRFKVITVLEKGAWIDPDDVEDLSQRSVFQKLNWMLEKIDLGRRKELKFSSTQDGEPSPLGRKSKKLFPEHKDGPIREWIDSMEEERIKMEEAKPHLKYMLRAHPKVAQLSPRHR